MTQMGLKTLVISDAPLKNQSNDTLFGLLQAIWIFVKFQICNISDASKHCVLATCVQYFCKYLGTKQKLKVEKSSLTKRTKSNLEDDISARPDVELSDSIHSLLCRGL